MLHPFRCCNPVCATGKRGFEFWAAVGDCPKCGASESDPQSARLIMRGVVIHFDPPGKWPGRGANVLACKPAETFRGRMATGDPNAVNCPECKLTDVWKATAEAWGYEVAEITPERAAELQAAAALELKKLPERMVRNRG